MNFICVPVCVCMCCEMNKWRCAALCVPSHTSHTPHSCVLLPDTRGAAELHKPREHSECEHTHTHTADADTAGPLFFGHPSLLWCVLCLTLPSLSCSFSSLCAAYWNLTSTTLSTPFALLRSPSVAVFFVSFSAPFTRVTLWLPLDCCSKTNMFLMLFLQFLPIKPEKNMLAGTNAGM